MIPPDARALETRKAVESAMPAYPNSYADELPSLMTAREVYAYLRISPSTLQRWRRKGLIQPCGPGRLLLFNVEHVRQLLNPPWTQINDDLFDEGRYNDEAGSFENQIPALQSR